MDRRKTLIPANHGPGRVGPPSGAAPAGAWATATKAPLDRALGRMSLAPGARRSSAFVTTKAGPAGFKADPRPVGDKAFQAACARTLIAYLAGHGYEFAVTPKVRAGRASC